MTDVLVLQEPEYVLATAAEIREYLAELGLNVHVADSPEGASRFPAAEVLITPTTLWLPAALEVLPRVKWIHFLSAGVDGIWKMPFDKRRYDMSKSTGVHASTISEYVMGAILYVLKGFGEFHLRQQRRAWKPFWLDECAGKTVGIVGVGTIGTYLARQAHAFGMTVIGTLPTAREIPHVDTIYPADQLEEVLERADFVVLLIPLTGATRHLIDAHALASMKPGAWLINVARGEVVDEQALIEALETNHLGGAVLDVFEQEPLHETSPLWDMPNVLVTPHVAGSIKANYMERALEVFKANYRRYVETGAFVTPVSVEKGY